MANKRVFLCMFGPDLLERISIAVNDPALGLAIGKRIAPRHGVGLFSVVVSEFRRSFKSFCRYQRLVYDVNPLVFMLMNGMELRWGLSMANPH